MSVIIIGAGAAGMMVAYSAASRGKQVVVIEKNDICGKKINITGKGRCNVTNDCDVPEFFKNVPVNPKFLYKAIYAFPPSSTIEFFENAGVPLVTERGRRVFPVSGKASDISSALRKKAIDAGAIFEKGMVKRVLISDNRVIGVELADGRKYSGESVVVATGGKSYPGTGSTGDGYRFAKEAGHTVIEPRPSLVPLNAEGSTCPDCMGLSLKNVGISIKTDNGKTLYKEQGEMLFTHFGVSGPVILSASAHIKSEQFPLMMYIDLKPALDEQTLDKRILRDFEESRNKDFINSLDSLLPQKIIESVVSLSAVPPHKKVNEITKAERASLVRVVKAFPVKLIGCRPIEEAVVTSGGVKVSEINPSTMESKLVGGLYFAGEVIDVDCYTGGYNLQASFSIGYICGQNC